MSCDYGIVYWEPAGDDPCEWCLESEGYYASKDDLPGSHDLCQCLFVEEEAELGLTMDYSNLTESSNEDEVVIEDSTACSSMDGNFNADLVADAFIEIYDFNFDLFDDECFREYCEAESGSYDPDTDFGDKVEVPAGYRWSGDVVCTLDQVDYQADAYLIADQGETSSSDYLGPTEGFTQRLIKVEFKGDLEECEDEET